MPEIIKKHRAKLSAGLFALSSVYLFILTQVSFINKILAAAICIGVVLHAGKIKFKFSKLREAVLFLLVCFYLTFAFFGFDLFFEKTVHENLFMNLFTFVPGFIWTGYVLQSLLDLMKAAARYKGRRKDGSSDKPDKSASIPSGSSSYTIKWILLFVIIFEILFLWKWVYNPVTLSKDSWEYLAGWRFGDYDSFRSPVYSFLIAVICRLAPTRPEVQWVVSAQIVALSALLSTFLIYLHRIGVRYKYAVAAAFILPLLPPLGLHTLVIWSDLACGISMLWLTYVLIRIIDEVLVKEAADRRAQISLCAQLVISLVLVFFIRSNSFLVYLVIAPALVILFAVKKNRKFLLAVIGSAVVVLLIRFPGYSALDVQTDRSAEMKYYAAMHDVQSVYYTDGNLSENTKSALRKYIKDLDFLDAGLYFIPDWVLYEEYYYYYDMSELRLGEFLSIYGDSLMHNPLKTLKSMFYRVRAYWVIDPKEEIAWVNYTNIYDRPNGVNGTQAAELGVYRKPVALADAADKYLEVMNTTIPATFVWRYGFWTALLVVSALFLAMRKQYIRLLAYIPVFVYLVSLYLTSGWTDYRYGLPVFLIGMFLPPAVILTTPAHDPLHDLGA